MPRLTTIAWILSGLACVAFGVVTAGLELRDLYAGLLEDPLAEPEVDEKTERPRRMLIAIGSGAGGLIPLGIGTVLLLRERSRARRSRHSGSLHLDQIDCR